MPGSPTMAQWDIGPLPSGDGVVNLMDFGLLSYVLE